MDITPQALRTAVMVLRGEPDVPQELLPYTDRLWHELAALTGRQEHETHAQGLAITASQLGHAILVTAPRAAPADLEPYTAALWAELERNSLASARYAAAVPAPGQTATPVRDAATMEEARSALARWNHPSRRGTPPTPEQADALLEADMLLALAANRARAAAGTTPPPVRAQRCVVDDTLVGPDGVCAKGHGPEYHQELPPHPYGLADIELPGDPPPAPGRTLEDTEDDIPAPGAGDWLRVDHEDRHPEGGHG